MSRARSTSVQPDEADLHDLVTVDAWLTLIKAATSRRMWSRRYIPPRSRGCDPSAAAWRGFRFDDSWLFLTLLVSNTHLLFVDVLAYSSRYL